MSARTILGISFLLITSLWAMKAFMHPGFYTSHDGWHQVARLYHWNQAVIDGQIPPRWSSGLYNGFGYPLFIFSYHLPWWLASPLVQSGVSIFDSIKIVFIVTYVVSGITMYLYARDLWGNWGGLVSAFIYLFTPYRFANIFVRANIGEAVSFVFIPLVFWAIYRLRIKLSAVMIAFGAIGIGGFMLSHVMVAFLFFVPFILTFSSYLFVPPGGVRRYKRKFILALVLIGVLGIGLAAYYLIPAIGYKSITVFNNLYHDLYKEHFTSLSKLLYSPWGYGAIKTDGEMSRQVGLVIWGILMFSTGSITYQIIKKRSINLNLLIQLTFLLSSIFAIFMMLPQSGEVWKLIAGLAIVDFPWRFLSVTTFCGAILAGGLIKVTSSQLIKKIMVIILILGAIVTNRNHLRVNQYTDIPLSLYIDSEITTNTDDEYLPVWVNRNYAKTERKEFISSHINSSQFKQLSNVIEFSYTSPKDSKEGINQMYFPGWVYYSDGVKQALNKDSWGAIVIPVFAGFHKAKLVFEQTSVMRYGEYISIVCIFITMLLIIRRKGANRA
ncbi:MAG: glycosyltransferase family 39 protein [Patescibacteria group bacterium]